jgi:hypothetical protein
MIEMGFHILVGDANGADKAVQRYLADKSSPNVLVHCMKDRCYLVVRDKRRSLSLSSDLMDAWGRV